jgi:hypothetical protein
LTDLKPGSAFLQALLRDAQTIGPHVTTMASVVIHAKDDNIVDQNRFFQDPPCKTYSDRNHINCCKPELALFERPVDDVAVVTSAP